MSKRLSPGIIRQRMVEWRNYRRLYPELRRKYEEVKEENQQLRRTVAEQQAMIEKLLLRVEELERMVFGEKMTEDDAPPPAVPTSPAPKKTRTSGSYRRGIPPPEVVTQRTEHPLPSCPDCGTALRRKRIVLSIIEDMVLPSEKGNPFKTVEERRIETGYCLRCRKRVAALPLPKQTCQLGSNVRRFVPYAVTVLGQSFEKVRTFLKDVCDLTISDGEITRILHEQKQQLLPAYAALAARVRDAPAAHYDETGYPVQAEGQGQFGWVKTAVDSPDALFLLGRTRGKGNAEELRGEQTEQIAITDDYGAYRTLFGKYHALCWAHPARKLRDLARSQTLSPEKRAHCAETYAAFCALYEEVRTMLAGPFDATARKGKAREVHSCLRILAAPHPLDPAKLATIKQSMTRNAAKYVTCLLREGIPADNNKAERSLRPLVIKRKLSFGSRTQKGADTMGVLLSVLMSLWWSRPKSFFVAYGKLLAA
jgi:transposase